MIRPVTEKDIPACVEVIRKSFLTVAEEFHFTKENAPRFTAFSVDEDRLSYYFHVEHRPMYAYVDGDQIIGYCSLFLEGNNACELNNLAILPTDTKASANSFWSTPKKPLLRCTARSCTSASWRKTGSCAAGMRKTAPCIPARRNLIFSRSPADICKCRSRKLRKKGKKIWLPVSCTTRSRIKFCNCFLCTTVRGCALARYCRTLP